jgi:hypothetical protein
METCLLPCRHVMHARIKIGYETVIPPMKSIPARSIVHSAIVNIAEGHVVAGGLLEISASPLPKSMHVSLSDKYSQSKALTEKIVDRSALQTTPTFSNFRKFHIGLFSLTSALGLTFSRIRAFPSAVLIAIHYERPRNRILPKYRK